MYRHFIKRLIDIVVAGILIIALSPLFLIIALLIRLEDGGPALFRQPRVGRRGQLFTVYKFRSMPVNTKQVASAEAQTLTITRIGAVLRRTNLDELPQLFNIFRGDMSLVGPRPALASQSDLCQLREQYGVHQLAPGLTGLAQIRSYDGMPETEKARWDAMYAKSVSFFNDLRIIFATLFYVLKPPPVY